MVLELYHYVHCPYCVRVRLALGHLDLTWKSIVIPYDDEETPVKLAGQKMLPIMKIDGKAMNESLDIIRAIDISNILKIERAQSSAWNELELIINKLGKNVHNLAMPYWVWTPEFTESSRAYFIAKKSAKRGPFDVLRARRNEFEAPLLKDLNELTPRIKNFWDSNELSILDIALASQLWGLFIVPEFRFPQEWHEYLMKVKVACRFDYQANYWRTA